MRLAPRLKVPSKSRPLPGRATEQAEAQVSGPRQQGLSHKAMTYGTLTEHRSAANDSGLESVLLLTLYF
jgi:hypothetical protein